MRRSHAHTRLATTVTAVPPELSSVRVRETESELIVEIELPDGVELPQLVARMHDGLLTITFPRTEPDPGS